MSSSATNGGSNVHDRVDQLEKLVTTLMAEKTGGDRTRKNTLPTVASPFRLDLNDESANIEAPKTPVHMTLDSDETHYTDSGHWMSILDSISELKDELDQIASEPQPYSHAGDDAGPELLLGIKTHATRQEILAGLPAKAEADHLLERYYNFVDVAPTIMHRPKFQREYDEFWRNPTETPVMWIGMLYGLFAIAIRIQSLIEEHDNGITDPSQRTFSQARQDLYRQKIAQCLVLANYTKCPPFTMETFLSYFVIEYLQTRDTQHGIWLLVGMLVRTAFRMGLHREPTKINNNSLTPFEAEMRRRMWSMVVRLDLMSSGQIGLPRMIHPAMTDTLEPRNLIDEDLHEDMVELPPARPDTEFTPMLYTIIRNRLLGVFARIVDLVGASEPPTYREVLELDEVLRDTYEKIPASLKGLNMKDFDPFAEGAMSIVILGLTFLKALEILHRPFLSLARDDSRYEYSRTACIDAALEILDIQHMMEVKSRDNKDLWGTKSMWWTSSWRLSSLMSHDFLLATSMLVIDLDRDLANPMPASQVPRERFKSGQPTRDEIISALTRAYAFWARLSPNSREARRVAAGAKHVLGKAGVSGFTPSCKSPVPPYY
ncbi:hypothetical protein SLS60_000564 [Paraconiothyrium brasiliense]|uniref:Xylanolytic transcriptional activator regulatory domain-containing protein n=1 Tax=Paraconiothyrium brasiliense TaxID=300254 RepID=A0ABR3S6M0_9PLEO